MKNILFLSIFSLLVACTGGGSSNPIAQVNSASEDQNNDGTTVIPHQKSVSIAPEAQGLYDLYVSHLVPRGFAAIEDLKIEVSSFDSSLQYESFNDVRGVCIKEENQTPRIVIVKEDWDDNSKYLWAKEALFWHLMGHCERSKFHNAAVDSVLMNGKHYDVPHSFMHPEFSFQMWPTNYYSNTEYTYLIDRFFTEQN